MLPDFLNLILLLLLVVSCFRTGILFKHIIELTVDLAVFHIVVLIISLMKRGNIGMRECFCSGVRTGDGSHADVGTDIRDSFYVGQDIQEYDT